MESAEPAEHQNPAAQGPVALDKPVLAQKKPAGQIEQREAPVTEENDPRGHAVQALNPLALQYVPNGADRHALIPVKGAKLPTAHAVTIDNPD